MFSVVARLGVEPGTRDAGTPVGIGVEAEGAGFTVEDEGDGEGEDLAAGWLFWFLVV